MSPRKSAFGGVCLWKGVSVGGGDQEKFREGAIKCEREGSVG